MSARKPTRAVAAHGRVYLIVPTARDREECLESARNSKKLHGPWGGPPSTPEQFARYLKRAKKDDYFPMLIRRLEDDALLGTINLGEIIRFNLQAANVGYNAFLPFVGQGYMTDGLHAALHFAFRTLKLHRVEAGIQPENVRSIALAERCGFEFEGLSRRVVKINGRWRDHGRWAILKEDWRAMQRRAK